MFRPGLEVRQHRPGPRAWCRRREAAMRRHHPPDRPHPHHPVPGTQNPAPPAI